MWAGSFNLNLNTYGVEENLEMKFSKKMENWNVVFLILKFLISSHVQEN